MYRSFSGGRGRWKRAWGGGSPAKAAKSLARQPTAADEATKAAEFLPRRPKVQPRRRMTGRDGGGRAETGGRRAETAAGGAERWILGQLVSSVVKPVPRGRANLARISGASQRLRRYPWAAHGGLFYYAR